MSEIRNLPILIVGSTILVCLVLILLAFGVPNGSSSEANKQALGSVPSVPTVTVPVLGTVTVEPLITSTVIWQGTLATVVNRRHILAGKSPDEIAQFVVRKVAPNHLGPEGPVRCDLRVRLHERKCRS